MYKEYIGLGKTEEQAVSNALEGLRAPEGVHPAVELMQQAFSGKSSLYFARASYLEWSGVEILQFGAFAQETLLASEKSPLEWYKLAEDTQSGILLLSRYCLRNIRFEESERFVRWSDSSLKAWLNDAFLQAAFSAQEQALLQSSPAGKVFILSEEEVHRYFPPRQIQLCPDPAKAVFAAPCAQADIPHRCAWWLRFNGRAQNCTPVITENGEISLERIRLNTLCDPVHGRLSVRPAIWLHPEAVRQIR